MGIAKSFLLGLALAATATATSAFAQKSQDTLRLAVNNPFAVLSSFELPIDEASNFSREVYDYLIMYDEYNKKFVPSLAKSWKRIDPQTIEFELRDDIKFHNGDKFEAADVKATADYIIDPKSKVTFPGSFTWIKEIEVLGPNKLRVHAVRPTGMDLMLLAYRISIYNGKLMDKMADKQDYGRLNPVGTGVYKVVSFDINKGILVERNDAYNTLPGKKANVRRVAGIPMPDKQTQAAQMLVGGIEMLRAVPPDTAQALIEQNKDARVTYAPTPNLIYLALDSVANGPNKALKDPRVRQAIFMGIDREAIIKHIVPGGHVAEHVQNLCFQSTLGCSYSVMPPKFDPAGAKKLLAEAGYPNGFEMNYVVFAPYKAIGEAIAGDLLKIGVRVSVQAADIALYRRLQADNKLEAWSSMFPTGNFPDSSNILGALFSPVAMKYFADDTIAEAVAAGQAEFDADKRPAIYKRAYDRNNEMSYNLAISSVPTVYLHSKDVGLKPNLLSVGENYIADYVWN